MLSVPLTVRLQTSRQDRHVTRELRDLALVTGVPGGYKTAEITLARPLALTPDEIAEYASLYVYDGRTADVVWQGQLEDPGRSAGVDGENYRVTAVGGAAHALDIAAPAVYVDRSLDRWVRADNFTPGADLSVGDDPGGGGDALVLRFPQGLDVVTNSRAVYRYLGLVDTGQKLARYDYRWDSGTNANWEAQAVTRTYGSLTSEVSRAQVTSTSGSGPDPRVVEDTSFVGDFPFGRDVLDLRYIRTGGSLSIGTDTGWLSFLGPYIRAVLKAADGTDVVTGYTAAGILASEVITDLLGRVLPRFDGLGASVDPTSYVIDHLVYADPVFAQTILDDMLLLHPDHFWAAWEDNGSGYRFEWSRWPTSVGYEATTDDGFDSPGSVSDLYNRVVVRWMDLHGQTRTLTRTQSVPVLSNAGITRQATVDMGDVMAYSGNAAQAGDAFLAQHRYAPNAGTLVVNRPILDFASGRMVQPWEIKPGRLIRVRNVAPRIDSLNATDRDGVTVFRVVEVRYTPAGGASLALDSLPRHMGAIVAQQRRDFRNARRR